MSDNNSNKYKNIRLKTSTYEELDKLLHEEKKNSMDATINYLIKRNIETFRYEVLITVLRHGVGSVERSECGSPDGKRNYGYTYHLWDRNLSKSQPIFILKPGARTTELYSLLPARKYIGDSKGNNDEGKKIFEIFEGDNFVGEFLEDIEAKIQQGYLFYFEKHWLEDIAWDSHDNDEFENWKEEVKKKSKG